MKTKLSNKIMGLVSVVIPSTITVVIMIVIATGVNFSLTTTATANNKTPYIASCPKGYVNKSIQRGTDFCIKHIDEETVSPSCLETINNLRVTVNVGWTISKKTGRDSCIHKRIKNNLERSIIIKDAFCENNFQYTIDKNGTEDRCVKSRDTKRGNVVCKPGDVRRRDFGIPAGVYVATINPIFNKYVDVCRPQ